MKLLGLTLGQLFAAILFGLLIAFAAVFMTAPHPVSVPVQVITPVPTPPPVVITQHPIPQATQIPMNVTMYDVTPDILGVAVAMLPIVFVMAIILKAIGFFGRRDDF